jgi:TRAP-type transport system periplasmic protein
MGRRRPGEPATHHRRAVAEVQDYVSLTYHLYTPGYILVNEAWWEVLPEQTRTVLAEAAREGAEAQQPCRR